METDLTVYEPTDETQSGQPPVGQFFSLPTPKSETLRTIPKGLIDRLFIRLWGWYGKAIEDKWGANTERAKALWREDLGGLTLDQIKAGMERCRDTCKFPPNLPEFRALCLNSGPKIDAEEHWKICLTGLYHGRAHYWAVQRFGYAELHATPWRKARFTFPAILREAMLDEIDGKLPDMPQHVRDRIKIMRPGEDPLEDEERAA